jgi:hypothetical protein
MVCVTGSRAAANPILLPKPKPRTMREHVVVPSIRSRDVACVQRSGIRHRVDALQPLDFGNGPLGVHPSQYLTERLEGQFGAASRKTLTEGLSSAVDPPSGWRSFTFSVKAGMARSSSRRTNQSGNDKMKIAMRRHEPRLSKTEKVGQPRGQYKRGTVSKHTRTQCQNMIPPPNATDARSRQNV